LKNNVEYYLVYLLRTTHHRTFYSQNILFANMSSIQQLKNSLYLTNSIIPGVRALQHEGLNRSVQLEKLESKKAGLEKKIAAAVAEEKAIERVQHLEAEMKRVDHRITQAYATLRRGYCVDAQGRLDALLDEQELLSVELAVAKDEMNKAIEIANVELAVERAAEAARIKAARAETARAETARAETARAETARAETARAKALDAQRNEIARLEAARDDAERKRDDAERKRNEAEAKRKLEEIRARVIQRRLDDVKTKAAVKEDRTKEFSLRDALDEVERLQAQVDGMGPARTFQKAQAEANLKNAKYMVQLLANEL
jgi:chromosome segregation ATPase